MLRIGDDPGVLFGVKVLVFGNSAVAFGVLRGGPLDLA